MKQKLLKLVDFSRSYSNYTNVDVVFANPDIRYPDLSVNFMATKKSGYLEVIRLFRLFAKIV